MVVLLCSIFCKGGTMLYILSKLLDPAVRPYALLPQAQKELVRVRDALRKVRGVLPVAPHQVVHHVVFPHELFDEVQRSFIWFEKIFHGPSFYLFVVDVEFKQRIVLWLRPVLYYQRQKQVGLVRVVPGNTLVVVKSAAFPLLGHRFSQSLQRPPPAGGKNGALPRLDFRPIHRRTLLPDLYIYNNTSLEVVGSQRRVPFS